MSIIKASCVSCIYYKSGSPSSGECHRYPPVMANNKYFRHGKYWPPVDSSDWCGDYAIALQLPFKEPPE